MMPLLKTTTLIGRVAGHAAAMSRLRGEDRHACAANLLEQHALTHPQSIAIKFENRRYTWGQLNAEANRVAAGFHARGLRHGDCVAMVVESSPEALFAILGMNKIGVIASLINTQLTGDALAHVLRSCRPVVVMADGEHLPAVTTTLAVLAGEGLSPALVCADGEAADVPSLQASLPAQAANPASTRLQHANDVMLYLYTSGTTGLPKAAIIRNRRFLTASHGFGVISQVSRDDVVYLTMPLYHATGMIAALGTALVSGAALALRRKFSAREFWADCVRYEATLFNYIGEICRYLLAAPAHPLERQHRLRAAMGAGMRADIWTRFQQRFGVPRIIEFYGATEGNIALINLENKPGMMGRLMPGQALVRIDEETEAFLRDHKGHLIKAGVGEKGILVGRITSTTRFDGYLDTSRNQDKLLRDPFGNGSDYFNSGDLAELHSGRWVSFADRLGDTYRWKGENISTVEVSNLLNGCAGVLESTVYGVTVAGCDGRAGMAVIVTQPDFAIDALAQDIFSKLPEHLRPVFLRLQGQIATTASFKYVKTTLQKDGFDPATLTDALFVIDPVSRRYQVLDAETHADIIAGRRRL